MTQEFDLLYTDFGDCAVGRGAVEVSWFLSQSLEPGIRREHEKELLHAYWASLHGSLAGDVEGSKERLADYSFEDFVRDYKLGALFNLCPAVILAYYAVEGKGDERGRRLAMAVIDRSVRTIEDHDLGELLQTYLS